MKNLFQKFLAWYKDSWLLKIFNAIGWFLAYVYAESILNLVLTVIVYLFLSRIIGLIFLALTIALYLNKRREEKLREQAYTAKMTLIIKQAKLNPGTPIDVIITQVTGFKEVNSVS